ncbi:MAG: TonB-dependent receptor [Steroidobacteraceae bacterium]
MSRHSSTFTSLLSIGVTVVAGQAALAQGSSPGVQADESVGLEEVLVTARKREESLQDVPLAVTAITAEAIADRQLQSIDDVAKFSPGLVFSKSFGRSTERPVVRGLASILAGTNATVETGVAYFVDGVYYPSDIQSLDLNDVERIEIIRGPQSALYGRNTYSGAINFITRKPSGKLSAGVSGNVDPDEKQLSLRLAGPLGGGEVVTGGLTARYYKFDGQWKNQLTGETIGDEETKSVSGSLNFALGENAELRLRAQHNEDDDGTRPLFFQSGGDNNCYPGTRSLGSYNSTSTNNTNQYYCGEIKPEPIYLNDATVTQAIVPVNGIPSTLRLAPLVTGTGGVYDTRPALPFSGVARELDLASFLARWDVAGSGWNAVLDGGVRAEDRKTGSDSDHSSVNIIGANVNGIQPLATGSAADLDKFRDWSIEAKLESPRENRLRGVIGVYHFEWERRTHRIDFASPEGQDRPYQISDIVNSAVFGSLEYDFSDRLSGTVEVRRAKEKKGQNDYATVVNVQAGPTSNATFDRKGEWDSTTPRITLDYKISPELTLYANWAKGFKPGGINGATAITAGRPQDVFFQQEESKNTELGMKSTWFERRLLLNVALYQIKVDDIQLTTPVNTPSGAITSISTNQGSGEIKGIEIESRFKVNADLTLGLTYALADTKFTKGCDDFQFQLTSGGGIYNPANPNDPARNLNGQGSCSIVGKEFPLAAKHTASLTADYRHPIMGGGYEFYVNSDLSYTSKKWVQVHNAAYTGSALLLGARVGVETERWKVGLYGRNLLNEDSVPGATRWLHTYLLGGALPAVYLDPGLPSATVASYSLPRGIFGILRRERQIGVEASYKY